MMPSQETTFALKTLLLAGTYINIMQILKGQVYSVILMENACHYTPLQLPVLVHCLCISPPCAPWLYWPKGRKDV